MTCVQLLVNLLVSFDFRHVTEDLLYFKAEPVLLPTDDENDTFLKRIKVELKNVMMKEDLDEATSKHLRTKLEEQMNMKLDKWKGYIDQEMLTILGQMDSPTLIKDYLYLGSEWNASNIEELTHNGILYIMNISREIDNFFPGVLHYYNIKEWDCEETDLLKHWENTHKYITRIRESKGKILVHCKMGISRSATTVLAYLMKEYNMSRQEAFDFVKDKRSCIMPNKAFWHQLETYEGILSASNQRHLFKKKSEVNITEKVKEEIDKEETYNPENFLEVCQEHQWSKDGLEESYPDVFLKDISDSCSYDFDMEIGSSSRSADSNEEFYPDLPSPQPEGATGGTKEFPVEECDDWESCEEEENDSNNLLMTSKMTLTSNIAPKSDTLTSQSRSESNTVPESETVIAQSKPGSVVNETSTNKTNTSQSVDVKLESENDLDIAEIEGDCDLESDKLIESTSLSDFDIHQHYIKENIPWSAGTVRKTKEGLEGKLKDTPLSSRSRTVSDDVSVETAGEEIKIIVTDDTKSEEFIQTIDGVTETEANSDKVEVHELKEKLNDGDDKRPTSVYDIEDIALPAGIVRRTTQEIEDRNRTNDESPDSSHKSLQRSSSLKTERDTPRKRRNSERRKTVTPILSPCPSSGDASPTKDISLTDIVGNDSVFLSQNISMRKNDEKKESEISLDGEKTDSDQNVSNIDSKDNDPNLTIEGHVFEPEERDLTVYKFLGEEVSLEKGIVKKQKMASSDGIELMNREHEKSESGSRSRRTSDNEVTCSSPSTPTEGKKANKDSQKSETNSAIESPSSALCFDKQTLIENSEEQSENQKECSDSKDNVASETTSKEGEGIEDKIPLFSEAKESFERASAKMKESNDVSLLHMPKSKKTPEPRFDAATLELIREIGSAILNSPAKAEVEDFEEEEAQLGSGLVRHYVKNIEKKTKVVKKKKLKEIIIIDKDSQEKKRPWRWSSPTDHSKDTSSTYDQSSRGDVAKKLLTQSVSSPILSSLQLIQLGSERGSESELAPITGSPLKKNGEISKSPPRKTTDSVSAICNVSETFNKKTVEENKGDESEGGLGVKCLVGRYEGSCDMCLGSPGSNSSLPDIKEVNSCESLKSLGKDSDETKGTNVKESESCLSRQSDSEESTNENCIKLRKIKNQLKKASLHNHRPKSVELVRRNSATPAPGWYMDNNSLMDENQSGFSWEGKKIRKLHGKSHPLAKLEWRRKFYNTM